MTLDFYDVENVVVRNIQIVQPQFWAIIVQGSKNVTFEHSKFFLFFVRRKGSCIQHGRFSLGECNEFGSECEWNELGAEYGWT